MNNFHNITAIRSDRLSLLIPARTFAGGATVGNPAETLFLWRSVATQKARGGTLAFYLDDARLEPLWSRPERYGVEFKRFGVAAVVEPDFSIWADDSVETQLYNVKKKAVVSRIFQECGLLVAPNLNWSDEQSFRFCFAGIPVGCPVAFTECRTAGGNDADRRAFLAGLTEGVKQVEPRHVVIYGGQEHSFWLADRLPVGPTYSLLEAWTSSRGKIRRVQEREVREQNQYQLFGGNEKWADAEAAAVA